MSCRRVCRQSEATSVFRYSLAALHRPLASCTLPSFRRAPTSLLSYAHLVLLAFRLRCWCGTTQMIDYKAAGEYVLLCIALQRLADAYRTFKQDARTRSLAVESSVFAFSCSLLARGRLTVPQDPSLIRLAPLQPPPRPLPLPARRVLSWPVA